LKALVYSFLVQNKQTFHHQNVYVCQTFRDIPKTIERVKDSMNRNAHVVTDLGGAYLQELLKTVD
jgi:formylmethanofuran dehydrogenase subunit A